MLSDNIIMFQFTVFVPCFNRAEELDRLLTSLESQTFRDFECIIIDDGSQDHTSQVGCGWLHKASFKIRYEYQDNSGKHVARNSALALSKGLFFVTVDSDAVLLADCLSRMDFWLNTAPASLDADIIGVEGHMSDMLTKNMNGDRYPCSPMISDFISIKYKMVIRGDKIRAIRTEVFKRHLFPVFSGEKFVAESVVWNKLAYEGYRFVFVNEVFASVEYLSEGLTSRSRSIRSASPLGALTVYREMLESDHFKIIGLKNQFRFAANYWRYYLHAKRKGRAVPASIVTFRAKICLALGAPIGLSLYAYDRLIS